MNDYSIPVSIIYNKLERDFQISKHHLISQRENKLKRDSKLVSTIFKIDQGKT